MLHVLHKGGSLFRDPPADQKLKFRQRRKTFAYVTEAAAKEQAKRHDGTTIEPYFSLTEIIEAGREIGMSFGGDGDDGQCLIDMLEGND